MLGSGIECPDLAPCIASVFFGVIRFWLAWKVSEMAASNTISSSFFANGPVNGDHFVLHVQ